MNSSLCPSEPESFTTGLSRSSLYLGPALCLITAIRAVGALPYLPDLNRLPKKFRCDFLGRERSIAQATSLPSWWTFIGRFWPSATSGKPVTLPMPSHGRWLVSLGQSGAGVCLVLPSTFACLLLVEGTVSLPSPSAAFHVLPFGDSMIWWWIPLLGGAGYTTTSSAPAPARFVTAVPPGR